MTSTQKTQYTLDAQGKRLGRLASEIAVLLMGKELPDFSPHTVANIHVTVSNAAQMDIDNKKKATKIYDRYSGYPGGRKTQNMEKLIADKGYAMVLKNAVNGMLPKNKNDMVRVIMVCVQLMLKSCNVTHACL